MLDGLAHLGHRVTAVNEPLCLTTADRVEMLERPWLATRLVARLASSWRHLIGRGIAARRSLDPDVVLVGYMGQFDVHLAKALFRRSLLVLDLLVLGADTARDRRIRAGLRTLVLSLIDRIAMVAADVVIVDTPEQMALLPAAIRPKTISVPVGAPEAWFASGSARARQHAAEDVLHVVFFGLFTPLQGALTIGRALTLLDRDDVHVTFVGTGQDYEATKAAISGRVTTCWVDWVTGDDLPDLVASHDVCLGIFGTTPKAMRVVPNKVFQGAAAGCAIITSDTPPQRRALANAAVFTPPGDGAALSAAIGVLADDGSLRRNLQEQARVRALRLFTPAAVARRLSDELGWSEESSASRP